MLELSTIQCRLVSYGRPVVQFIMHIPLQDWFSQRSPIELVMLRHVSPIELVMYFSASARTRNDEQISHYRIIQISGIFNNEPLHNSIWYGYFMPWF